MPDSGAHGRPEPRYRTNVPKVTAREFFKSALSLRMIALFLGLVVVAGVCIRLGSWQLDRASERANQQAAAQAAADTDSAPQPLESVLQPGETFIGAVENQRISVRGEYEPEGQLLDRKSTRLNSSHVAISYAVFCLKKKTNNSLNIRCCRHQCVNIVLLRIW